MGCSYTHWPCRVIITFIQVRRENVNKAIPLRLKKRQAAKHENQRHRLKTVVLTRLMENKRSQAGSENRTR